VDFVRYITTFSTETRTSFGAIQQLRTC